MRIVKSITVIALLTISGSDSYQTVAGSEIATLSEYTESNPTCLTKQVIYDGCTVMLNSDGEYLFGQFNILHPELQMRILMQGLTFYVDPTGKKKEKYALHFPAASAVEVIMSRMAPPEPSEEMMDDTLPDITPLVSSISSLGAEFEINRKSQTFNAKNTAINLDDNTHCLSYSFIIPIENMLKEKKLNENWTLGIYTEGGRPSNGGPGMGGPGMGGPGMGGPGMGGPGMGGPGMGGPGMGGPSIKSSSIGDGGKRKRGIASPERNDLPSSRQEKEDKSNSLSKIDLRKLMMNDIEVWIPFSFSQICSMEE